MKLLQAGTGGHGSRHQHESWCALGQRAVRCDRPSQMAIWCVVTRCHLGQSHGVWRPSRVSSCSWLSSSKNENQEAKKTHKNSCSCSCSQTSSHHRSHAEAFKQSLWSGRGQWPPQRPLLERIKCTHLPSHWSSGKLYNVFTWNENVFFHIEYC